MDRTKHSCCVPAEPSRWLVALTMACLLIVLTSCATQSRVRTTSENAAATSAASPTHAAAATGPVAALDWRHRIPASAFEKTAEGEWTSPLVQPDFPFDELIYSWHLHRPGDTFRLYLKSSFGPADETDWLYAGFWGAAKDPVAKRTRPAFDLGLLDMDWLKLKTNAMSFRFKVIAAGAEPLAMPPAIPQLNWPRTVASLRTN